MEYLEPVEQLLDLVKPQTGLLIGFEDGDYPADFRRIKPEAAPLEAKQFDFIHVVPRQEEVHAEYDITKAMNLVEPLGLLLVDDYGVSYGNADFAIRKAADKLLTQENGWRRAFEHIRFANDAKCYFKEEQ